jgi:hypothetical protein
MIVNVPMDMTVKIIKRFARRKMKIVDKDITIFMANVYGKVGGRSNG